MKRRAARQNPIPVTWMKQIHGFFCGPATVAMVLRALRVRPPVGVVGDDDWQNWLWEQIKQITTGPPRSPDAKGSEGYLEEFDHQQCFFCNPDWYCWAATPQALHDLLNRRLPRKIRVRLQRSSGSGSDAFMETVLHSVDTGVPATLGKGDETHWIVVHGYKVGPGKTFGQKQIQGIYVRDPQVPPDTAGTGNDFIPIDEFVDSFLGLVRCGADEDKNKLIAIVVQ